jgi:hypothetical protein
LTKRLCRAVGITFRHARTVVYIDYNKNAVLPLFGLRLYCPPSRDTRAESYHVALTRDFKMDWWPCRPRGYLVLFTWHSELGMDSHHHHTIWHRPATFWLAIVPIHERRSTTIALTRVIPSEKVLWPTETIGYSLAAETVLHIDPFHILFLLVRLLQVPPPSTSASLTKDGVNRDSWWFPGSV